MLLTVRKDQQLILNSTLFYRPGQGRSPSYKTHVASNTNGFITAVLANPSALHDTGAVPELVEAHEKILGSPDFIAADTKYGSEECLRFLQEKGIKTAIKPETKNNRWGYFSKEEFKYNKDKDIYTCPNGKILKRKAKNYKINRIKYCADLNDCITCSLKEKCITPNTKDFRFITKYDSPTYDNAYEWYSSDHGQNLQKLRKTVLEGIIGQVKEYHGMDKAKFREINKVQIQFLLIATAINLKKMIKILEANSPKLGFLRIISKFYKFIQNILENRSGILILTGA